MAEIKIEIDDESKEKLDVILTDLNISLQKAIDLFLIEMIKA